MNTTHFLNIDLEIESKEDILILVEELSSKLCKLSYHECNGAYCASFEPHEFEIERIISEYLSAITSLSDEGRRMWEACVKREFNLGFQAGVSPRGYEKFISQNSLKEILSVNGQLGITIYASEPSIT
jgi:hypothetical protein